MISTSSTALGPERESAIDALDFRHGELLRTVLAVIYSDDAPALENALHKAFLERRVNLVNPRKEFFRAPLAEIARVVREHHGEIVFTRVAEAGEFRKTISLTRQKSGNGLSTSGDYASVTPQSL